MSDSESYDMYEMESGSEEEDYDTDEDSTGEAHSSDEVSGANEEEDFEKLLDLRAILIDAQTFYGVRGEEEAEMTSAPVTVNPVVELCMREVVFPLSARYRKKGRFFTVIAKPFLKGMSRMMGDAVSEASKVRQMHGIVPDWNRQDSVDHNANQCFDTVMRQVSGDPSYFMFRREGPNDTAWLDCAKRMHGMLSPPGPKVFLTLQHRVAEVTEALNYIQTKGGRSFEPFKVLGYESAAGGRKFFEPSPIVCPLHKKLQLDAHCCMATVTALDLALDKATKALADHHRR